MFTPEDIVSIIEREYGLRCNNVRKLHGYLVKNYRVNNATNSNEYVVRVVDSGNCMGEELTDEIHKIQEYLFSNGFQVCNMMKTKSGFTRCRVLSENGNVYHITVARYLPGKSIAESNLSSKQLIDVAADVGRLAAYMHKCLAGYKSKNEAPTNHLGPRYVWYTYNFYNLKQHTTLEKDENLYQIIKNILEDFKEKVHPVLKQLRKGWVHGDFSNTNLILLSGRTGQDTLKNQMGIIDFEDSHEGPYVFDLTVCMAYTMTNCDDDPMDQLLAAGKVLAGYQSILPLTQIELSVLYLGVLSRLVTSYTMYLNYVAKEPENKEYLTTQASKCPDLLRLLSKKGEKWIMNYWLNTKL